MRKQAQMTMRCMQALVRVQARVRARRFQLNHEKLQNRVEEYEEREFEEQEPKPMSPMKRIDMDRWDNRRQSSLKIKENDLRKHEAAMKRERALAYAFNYQVRQFYLELNYHLLVERAQNILFVAALIKHTVYSNSRSNYSRQTRIVMMLEPMPMSVKNPNGVGTGWSVGCHHSHTMLGTWGHVRPLT